MNATHAEPLTRTIARHRIIRTLVVYRMFFIGWWLMLLVYAIKFDWLNPSLFIGMLGYDWLIHYQLERVGPGIAKYGGMFFWWQFGFFACLLVGSCLTLARLNQLRHRGYHLLRATLRAIPISMLAMSCLCSVIGAMSTDFWHLLIQFQHDGPLYHRGFIVANGTPTFPLLILAVLHGLFTICYLRKLETPYAWLSDVKTSLRLLFFMCPVVFFFWIIMFQIYAGKQTTYFEYTSFATAKILLIVSAFWQLIFISLSLMRPPFYNTQELLIQVRHTGYGLYYPYGISIMLLLAGPLCLYLSIFCFPQIVGLILYGDFEYYAYESSLHVMGLPGLIIQYWVLLTFISRLKPRTLLICPKCRYDLTGTLMAGHTHCPECGKAVSGSYRLRKRAAQAIQQHQA